MILLRRIGRERLATMPIDEARAVMRLLYDDFACHCAPDLLEGSLQLVLDRLEERAERKSFVELLPLPTGPKDLNRLKRLFRYSVYNRYYPNDPVTRKYLEGGIREAIAKNPKYLEDELSKIAAELEARPAYTYANRDKSYTWEGSLVPPADEMPPEA
jgi:hypothetical protein